MNYLFKNRVIKWILILMTIVVFLEVTLRLFGFCDAVLIREDSAFEYIAIPQDRNRFGKHIFYNRQCQRNAEIEKSDSNIICAFGDSFINGGTPTDQDSLATTKLSKYLSKKYLQSVKVLNISAGSWGPDNCFAYLMKYGNFKSKQFILFVSSHDAYDNMDFHKVVGVNPQFPAKQYNLAIVELVGRYIVPKLLEYVGHSAESNEINKKMPTSVFNTGFFNFYNYCKKNDIEISIYLHPDKTELINRQYNDQGKMIIDFCKQHQIKLIPELEFNFPLSAYRDGIHVNEQGQQLLFDQLKDSIIVK